MCWCLSKNKAHTSHRIPPSKDPIQLVHSLPHTIRYYGRYFRTTRWRISTAIHKQYVLWPASQNRPVDTTDKYSQLEDVYVARSAQLNRPPDLQATAVRGPPEPST